MRARRSFVEDYGKERVDESQFTDEWLRLFYVKKLRLRAPEGLQTCWTLLCAFYC